ncbi:MAG: ATP-binding protein [Armatimonadetes bacterium]|nr:ATP-binding protein [Armatimonadota bacterium]
MPGPGQRTFRVPSRLDALGPVRLEIERLAAEQHLRQQAVDDIVLCVHEAVSNAIVHGHRENEALQVEVTVESSDGGLKVTVRDSGPGFDVEETLRRLASEADHPRGRGLRIIRSLADEYAWSDDGRELTIIKRR